MQKGWQIFSHSVRLVMRNLGAAFRVSFVLYLVQVANQIGYFVNPPEFEMPMDPTMDMPMMTPGMAVQNLILGILAVVASLWIAVAWHRYVLTEEYPTGWLPKWHGPELLGYLGRSILIGILVVLGIAVASVPVGFLSMGAPGLAGLFGLGLVGLAAYLFLRMGAILPAAAVGERLTLSDAWSATRADGGAILTLAFIVIAASLIIQLPSWINGDPGSVINLVYGIVVNWFATIIGISVLTTIYGHYVEKRPID